MKFQTTISLAALLRVITAHTIFVQLNSNPISYGIRDPSYDGPITDVTTNYIACNGGPNPTTASSNVINVNAGDTVQAIWRHTLTSDATDVIDPSHLGPVMAYMKKVTDATTDVGYGSGWFKISEAGYNPSTKDWAVTDLINNQGIQSITIPSCIANGQYLLRAELIALHAASNANGAQFYMECAQINVSGGSGSSSPSTVSFPGAYSQTDPGILINIYSPITSYTIPGPQPFTCGAGGGSSPPATTLLTTTKPASPTTTSKTATSTPASAGAPLYGQCGGTGWTGSTSCASGTCTVSSTYYSQCLP